MDAIMSLLQDFDPAAFIPELNTVLGWIELLARLSVMVGPLILLALGLFSFLAPPKEANHKMGFRTLWGMGSVEAWQFTQRLAGICWTALGFLLTVVMALICNSFRGLDTMQMVQSAGTCLLWEIGLIVASYIGINVTVIVRYDWKGNRRPQKR